MTIRNERVRAAAEQLSVVLHEETDLTHFQPHRDRVLVLPIKEDENIHKRSGLYLPAKGRAAKHSRALVISAGPGHVHPKSGALIPVDVTAGDMVIVGSSVGELIEDQDVEYRLVRNGDILAILEN